MGLQTNKSIDDMNARLLQFLCPGNVGLFIESSLDFHQRQNRFPRFGGTNQGFDDGAVTAGSIQGLFDGEHLRVCCSVLQECLNAGGKGLIRVVNQHVSGSNRPENIGFLRGLGGKKLGGGNGQMGWVFQVWSIEVGNLKQPCEAQGRWEPIDLVFCNAEFANEEIERDVVHVLGDFETNWWAKTPTEEFALECLNKVFALVFLDFDVFVPGHPKLVVLEHLHSGEKLLHMVGYQIFNRDVAQSARAIIGELDKPG